MEQKDALDAITALSHATRLAVLRMLIVAGPDGLAAGTIAERLDVLKNTLSTHLGLLVRSGLVSANRNGRSIRYAANFDAIRDLMAFLIHDCCNGKPEICAPLMEIAQGAARRSAQPEPQEEL